MSIVNNIRAIKHRMELHVPCHALVETLPIDLVLIWDIVDRVLREPDSLLLLANEFEFSFTCF